MTTCPSCSHENPDDRRECERCGAPLDAVAYVECPSCQALNPLDRQYCRHCFANLQGEEDAAVDDSLISPYTPPSTSPDEFREQPEATTPHADVGENVDLDATLGDMLDRQEPERPLDLWASNRAASESAAAEPKTPAIHETASEATAHDRPDIPADEGLTGGRTDRNAEEEALAAPEAEMVTDTEPVSETEFVEEERLDVESVEPSTLPESTWLSPTASPLEGVDNPIPMEPIVALPHRSAPPVERSPTHEERADAHLFQQIAEEPPPLRAPAVHLVPQKPEILSRVGRITLYALLLAAALCPLVTGGRTAVFIQPRESVAELATNFSALPGGSVVLVSFDYSPAYAGELNPLAEAVIEHLAAQSVPVVALATKPEGVGLAAEVLNQVAAQIPQYTYGDDYVLLGYLPGQEVGLRTLALGMDQAFKSDQILGQPLYQLRATQGLATVQDAAQILVIADDEVAVRRWIEQVGSRLSVEIHALATARVEPMLVTYEQAGQLSSVIAGVYGAAQYRIATGVDEDAAESADALAALVALMLLMAIATNVIYAIRGEKSPSSTS